MRRVEAGNRGRTPLEITLKAWAAFSGDEQEVGRLGWYDFFVRKLLDNKAYRPALEKIAAAILDGNGAPITRDQWLMLQRDNVPAKGSAGLEAFGIKPTPLAAVAYDWLGRFHKGGKFAGRRINLTATT